MERAGQVLVFKIRSIPARCLELPETDMNCLRQTIETTRLHAYAHHIQRLMITGNFALLTSLAPAEVEEWYLQVYADAFEWVELPNTHGMGLAYRNLFNKPEAEIDAIVQQSEQFLETLNRGDVKP